MKTTFTLTRSQHSTLMAHLFLGDGLEAAALGLCSLVPGHDRERLLLNKVILIPHDKCIRKPDLLSWDSSVIIEALNEADSLGLSIMKIHSHPGYYNQFSLQDNRADREIFPSFYNWVEGQTKHFSAIFLPNGDITYRYVKPNGEFEPCHRVCILGDEIQFLGVETTDQKIHAFETRLLQTYGEKTHRIMRSLRIGVVGCSGTGSCVIEALKRHMVGEIVLVDPDGVEEKNLNRIVASKLKDAIQKKLKVDVFKEDIESTGLGSKVICHASDLANEEVIRDLRLCDIIIGCVDSIRGRHLLNLICTYYSIPYFDVGVSIHADGKGGINQACAGSNYLQPGLSTLLNREVYSTEELQSEILQFDNPNEYERLKKEGYVRGIPVDRPAVYSLNCLAAALVVEDLFARIHGYRIEKDQCSQKLFSLIHNEYFIRAEDSFPIYVPWKDKVGLGDKFFELEGHRLKKRVSMPVEMSL